MVAFLFENTPQKREQALHSNVMPYFESILNSRIPAFTEIGLRHPERHDEEYSTHPVEFYCLEPFS